MTRMTMSRGSGLISQPNSLRPTRNRHPEFTIVQNTPNASIWAEIKPYSQTVRQQEPRDLYWGELMHLKSILLRNFGPVKRYEIR